MSKVAGIIPARYSSSRFPGKALAQILGKSLIQRTYENALLCPLLSDLIVATDDSRIFEHVEAFGGKAVMTSPECPTGTDRLAEAVKNTSFLNHVDIFLNIQGDEPCLDPKVMQAVIEALQEDPQAPVSTAITPLLPEEAHLSSTVKCVIDLQQYALYFSRALIPGSKTLSFNKKHPYWKHLGLYCYRRDFLLRYPDLSSTPLQQCEDLEQLKILEHGYKIKTAIVETESMDVNTPEDIKKVELLLCKQNTYS
jgi:3-deoxy-manno-octulosonate cytidylyltransferase (CMP-KDO synthetase)